MTSGTPTLTRDFFPQGHALRIVTNEPAVLEQAECLWRKYPRLSKAPPVRIEIIADPGNDQESRSAPVCKVQGSRVLFRAGRQNRAYADLRSCTGHGRFTREFLNDSDYWRYHFLEPLGYTLVAARHFTLLHAACIAYAGRAVLLCGESGAGKTCLAFAAARKRWQYVSGDATALVRDADRLRVIGRPFEIRFRHTAMYVLPELRRFEARPRPNGKTDIEFDPSVLGIPTAIEVSPVGIVILSRGSSKSWTEEISWDQCRHHLSESICFGDQDLRNVQTQSLERLRHLPRYRLHYSDLNSAEELLWTLVHGNSGSAVA